MQHDVSPPEHIYDDGLIRCRGQTSNAGRCKQLVHQYSYRQLCGYHRSIAARHEAKQRRLKLPGRKVRTQCLGSTKAGTRCRIMLWVSADSPHLAYCSWHSHQQHWGKPHGS